MIDLEELKNILKDVIAKLIDQNDQTREVAAQAMCRFFDPQVAVLWSEPGAKFDAANTQLKSTEASLKFYWKISSFALDLISKQMLVLSTAEAPLKNYAMLREITLLVKHLLAFRNVHSKNNETFAKTSSMVPERISSNSALEISLLLLFNSPDLDISRFAADAMTQFVIETELLEDDTEAGFVSFMENIEVYRQIRTQLDSQYWSQTISSKTHHKCVRNIMKLFKKPSVGILGVWEEAYRRWEAYYDSLINADPQISTNTPSFPSFNDEEDSGVKRKNTVTRLGPTETKGKECYQQEWYNYCGLLLIIYNVCRESMSNQVEISRSPTKAKADSSLSPNHEGALSPGISSTPETEVPSSPVPWAKFSSDRRPNSATSGPFGYENFISELLSLMVSSVNPSAREAVKEIIGNDMGGQLCGKVF